MIKEILELLRDTDCKSEIVQIAKGKNKFPDSFKEVFKKSHPRIKEFKEMMTLSVTYDLQNVFIQHFPQLVF